GETDRHCIAPESATHVQALTKPMPDAEMRRCERREISPAKVLLDDRGAVERPSRRVLAHPGNSCDAVVAAAVSAGESSRRLTQTPLQLPPSENARHDEGD